MNTFTNLLTSLIVAGWVAAIAIISVQNYTLVSVKFLTFQSIQIPIGIVLGFSAAAGVIGGAIAPIIFRGSSSPNQNEEFSEDDDVDF
ncbi:MAG TPA: LapA family protein [Oculatellaceae cyanobacterium]|jgi:uncharacterized integral membrane protein